MNSQEHQKRYEKNQQVFERDSRRLKIYRVITVIVLIMFLILNVKLCGTVEGQSVEVKNILNSIASSSWTYPNGGNMYTENGVKSNSDTTEVIYVLLKEDYLEEIYDTIHRIPYPYLETIYGYYVQNWKPYSVIFYDSKWNIIEEPLFIRKRKLFKK